MQVLDIDGILRDTLGNPQFQLALCHAYSHLSGVSTGCSRLTGAHRFLQSRNWNAKKVRSSLILPHLKRCICSFVNLLFSCQSS